MPVRKKECLRKKKRILKSHSFPKKKSKLCATCAATISGLGVCRRPSVVLKKNSNIGKYRVKTLLNSFYKFGNYKPRISETRKRIDMPIFSSERPNGLSPKEKSYVINCCQKSLPRYLKLKSLASSAIKENKVFSVIGNCNALRKVLTERGWVERIPPYRMNLSKLRNGTFKNKPDIRKELERILLSHFVEKCCPNFVWVTKDEQYEPQPPVIDMSMNKGCVTVVNKLNTDAMWTTKQGLCSSMKRNYWFYIEDVAEVNIPRTYNSYENGEVDEFVKDYKITACTNLLKWILSMVANDQTVFEKSGKIPLSVFVFALNRCKEYLFRRHHKDIDKSFTTPSSSQWNSFLKNYYRIIAKKDVFKEDENNKLPLYLSYTKVLLKEIYKYRPQLSCEGCHNIWIIKPAHCSRGRGIRMASKLAVITDLLNKANAKFVIQKYIEEPLLIHETKFDIRQYYLVTSTYPLVIWMYRDCYLKFSSQKYNLKNYHESIHLTNNAVQRRYKNCSGRSPELPQNNMWHSETYKEYLAKIGKDKVWENIIYPGMRKTIIGIMLSCQDTLNFSKNRFELYGCDFILDKQYKPWLIEINSCPDLNHTTQVTAKICPAVVSDIIKVVIDYAADSKCSTGKFECIYRQPITTPRYGTAADLLVRGISLPLDYFYKGKIEIEESYEDPNLIKQLDIKSVLSKLKHIYDPNIMIKLGNDDETVSNPSESMKCCTHNTASENELEVAATVITEQLDEIIDTVSSENNYTQHKDTEPDDIIATFSSLKLNLCKLNSIKSVTDINAFLKASCNGFIPKKNTANPKQALSFSHLAKILHKKSFAEIKTEETVEKVSLPYDVPELNTTQQVIMKASSRMVTFINKKEQEYCNNLK